MGKSLISTPIDLSTAIGIAPSTATDQLNMFIDSATNQISAKNSAGALVPLNTGAAAGYSSILLTPAITNQTLSYPFAVGPSTINILGQFNTLLGLNPALSAALLAFGATKTNSLWIVNVAFNAQPLINVNNVFQYTGPSGTTKAYGSPVSNFAAVQVAQRYSFDVNLTNAGAVVSLPTSMNYAYTDVVVPPGFNITVTINFIQVIGEK